MKCEFCGFKLKRTDRTCPNCGGANAAFYDIDNENLENTLDRQEDAIRELQEDVNTYKQKSKKNSTAIIVVVILMIFLIIFPATCCCVINFSVFNMKVEPEKDLLDDEYNYDYDYDEDENKLDTDFNEDEFDQYLEDNDIHISGNVLELDKEVKITINGNDLIIPMKAGDFVEYLDVDFPENYVINAKDDDYVNDRHYEVSLNIYNISDTAKDYKECELGGIAINIYDEAEDIGLESLYFYGVTLDSSFEEVVEIFGEPSSYFTTEYTLSADWDTENGWVNLEWTPEGKLVGISIFNHFDLYSEISY